MTTIPQYFPFRGRSNDFKTIEGVGYMPRDFFRLLIVGPSGSGKTNLLMHLLFRPQVYYDKVILYAKNLEQHYYREMVSRFGQIAERLQVELDDLLQVSNGEVEDLETINSSGQKIVIFDDYICSLQDQAGIAKYFIGGRHKRVSVIYLSQSYFRIPKDCRLNCNYYIVYDFPSKKERDLVSSELQVDKEKLRAATRDPYSFLFVSLPDKKIYKCFDQEL